MSRVCELTGKKFMSGNNVSHANNKTKRKFDINLQPVSLKSEILKETFKMKIAATTITTLSKHGLDLKNVILKAISNASHTIKVEIEVETIADVKIALDAGAGIIMLDNMSLSDMASAVELCKDKAITEASGGINLSSVKDVAETGVDLISVGAITHSAPNLDLSMDIKQ